MIGDTIEPRTDRARNIGREMDLHAGHLRLGALRFGGAVEKKLDFSVGSQERDAVAFENAKIRGVAQIVALPGVTVEHEVLDAGLLHGRGEA